MPTALQLRRGTTSQNNSFTGVVGEVSVDTDKDTLRVHDGSTAGGFEVVTTTATQTLTNKTLTSPIIASAAFSGASFTFEGATDDSFETTLTATDPTADRTVTIPNATTTLVGRDTTDTLTNKTLTSPVISTITGGGITLDSSVDIVLDADGANVTLKDAGTTVLDFVLNGTTDVTLDAPGDIKLDADGGDVFFLDGGSTYGSATNNSGNLIIKSGTTTAATFDGANVTLAGTVASGAITSSGTITGTQAILSNASPLVFEGATSNAYETTFAITDPTADRTVTFQDATGTVAYLSDITGGGASEFSTVTVNTSVIFEGSTDDSNETTLVVTDPTADRTITLPNATGTLVLKDTTDTLTNKSIDSDNNTITNIVNADIKSAAGINFSKMEDLTASRALVSDSNGDVSVSAVTSTEIGYLDGVSSAIQTQIDANTTLANTKASKAFAIAQAVALG